MITHNYQNEDGDGDYSVEDFYSGVAQVLVDALAEDPEQQELRFRLIEVYCTTGQRGAFEEQAKEYQQRVTDPAEDAWQKILKMAASMTVKQFDHAGEAPAAGGAKKKFRRFGEDADPVAFAELSRAYRELRADAGFLREVDRRQTLFAGDRPSPLYWAKRLSARNGGAQIHLKREGLHPPGSHKLINALGQGLVARKLGLTRLVAGTISGQGGVAVAAAAAHLGLGCTVYMYRPDIGYNAALSERIKLLGAVLQTVDNGPQTTAGAPAETYVKRLNEARNRALDDWLGSRKTSFYVNGLAAGPDPYPSMQHDFLAIIGRETRQSLVEATGGLPDAMVASVDSEMDIISFFTPFLSYRSLRLVATRARRDAENQELQRKNFSDTQVQAAARILSSQGFPSTSREHQWLAGTGRVDYCEIDPTRANQAARQLAECEGLIVSRNSACALAQALYMAPRMRPDQHLVVLLSDVGTVLTASPEVAAIDGADWSIS